MPYKKRSEEEIQNIIKDYEGGNTLYEISKKYEISDDSIYALIKSRRGIDPFATKRKQQSKIKKLQKQIDEKDKEIALLRAALKKS